jgi:hypothetical protein
VCNISKSGKRTPRLSDAGFFFSGWFDRLKDHDWDLPFDLFLVFQVGRVMFNGILPKLGIFPSLGIAGDDRNFLAIDIDPDARIGTQVVVSGRIGILAPVGSDHKIETIQIEIGNRREIMFARFAPHTVQQQDSLRAKPASKAPLADPDQESVENRKPFNQEIFHFSRYSFIGSQ